MVEEYVERVKTTGYFEERRRYQQRYWMYEAIDEQLKSRFYNAPGMGDVLSRYEQLLLQGGTTSFAAASRVLDYFDRVGNGK